MSIVRSGSEELFMDRLIIASIAELRGSERFKLIGEVVDDPKISKFYTNLYVQELEHINSFQVIFLLFLIIYLSDQSLFYFYQKCHFEKKHFFKSANFKCQFIEPYSINLSDLLSISILM